MSESKNFPILLQWKLVDFLLYKFLRHSSIHVYNAAGNFNGISVGHGHTNNNEGVHQSLRESKPPTKV